MVGLCRLCASLKKPNCLITIKDQSDEICLKLQKCFRLHVQFNDSLPSICQECLHCLNVSYKFYIKVLEAQETLEALFPSTADETSNNSDNGEALPQTPTTTNPQEEQRTQKCIKKPSNISSSGIKIEKSGCRKVVTGGDGKTNVAIANQVSNVASVSDDIENDGYLREVYSILGMAKSDDNKDSMALRGETAENLHKEAPKYQEHMETETVEEYTEGEETLEKNESDDVEFEEVLIVGTTETEDEIEIQDDKQDDIINEEKNGHGMNNLVVEKDFSTLPPMLQLSSWSSYVYLCYVCDYKASSFTELSSHARTKHSVNDINKLQFKCYDCQRVIGRYNAFLNHVRLKHHPGLKLRCDACDKLCVDCHQYEHHRNVDCSNANQFPNHLQCKKCCKSFHSPYGLQLHIKRQHMIQENRETFQCNVTSCNKEFAHKRGLKAHEITHEQQKNFACEFCDKLFFNKSNLEAHRCTHISESVYQCHICQKSFKSDTILRKHQLLHTDTKPFGCAFCSRVFRTKIEQTTHERVHTGEMPLQCIYCEKRFRFRSALTAHLKVHSGVKEHACKYCPKTFIDISNFKKHVRRIHFDEDEAANKGQIKQQICKY